MKKYLLIKNSYDSNDCTHTLYDTQNEAVESMKKDYDFSIRDNVENALSHEISTDGVPSAFIVWDDFLFESWQIFEIDTNGNELKITEPFID